MLCALPSWLVVASSVLAPLLVIASLNKY